MIDVVYCGVVAHFFVSHFRRSKVKGGPKKQQQIATPKQRRRLCTPIILYSFLMLLRACKLP